MLGRSRIGHWIRSRYLHLLPILLLVALLGPPLFQSLPSFRHSPPRKLGPGPELAKRPAARPTTSWSWWGRKPTLQQYTEQHCMPLWGTHQQLLEPMLQPWNQTGFSLKMLENTSGDRVYTQDGRLSLSNSTTLHRLIPTFVNYIQHIAELVQLPDLLLPLNPADEPLAQLKASAEPTPLLAFCKTPGFSDILIPNTLEGKHLRSTFAAAFSLSKSLCLDLWRACIIMLDMSTSACLACCCYEQVTCNFISTL